MGPHIEENSGQSDRKSGKSPKKVVFGPAAFLTVLGSAFSRLFVDFGVQNGAQNDEKTWSVRPWMGEKKQKPRKLLFRCFRNAVFIDFGSQIGQKSDAKSIQFRSEADKNMTRRQEHNKTQTSTALLTWTTEVGLLAQNVPRTCRLTSSYRRTPTTKRGRRCSPPWGAFN